METTANLKLPYLMPSQAQKHVTHNEALAMLDTIVQLAVLDRDLTSPPGAPDEGDRHIGAAGASGDWDGQDGKVAVRQDGGWSFLSPRTGWIAWIANEGELFHFTGSAWASVAGTIATLQNLGLIGIGTTADATNPFSAKLNKALWAAKSTGEGGDGDLRYTLNKEGAANVLSLLMQTGWAGRAELGLIGDDNLALKVSPDGSSWTTALTVDRTSGKATVAADPTDALGIASKQYADAKVARTGDVMTGNLGVHSAPFTPLGQLHLVSENTGNRGLVISQSSANAAAAVANTRKSRGTYAAPAIVSDGDFIFAFSIQPYAGGSANGGYPRTAAIAARVTGTPSGSGAGSVPTSLVFSTGSTDDGPALNERLRITDTGDIQMGGANTVITSSRHPVLRGYTVASLPAASPAGQLIYVADGSGNRRMAVSDGTGWRFPDGAIVS